MTEEFIKKIRALNEKDQADEIIAFMEELSEHEQIPKNKEEWEIIGYYIRALNNTNEMKRAIAVSLHYQEQGKEDPIWYYRLGYSYLYLNDNEEAEKILLQGKEIAKGNEDAIEWIDELLEIVEAEKQRAISKARAEARRRTVFIPHDKSKPYFDGVDFENFWEDSDYHLKSYVGATVTDAMFAEAEQTLGYKLPEAYKQLMKQHNGGAPYHVRFEVPFASDSGDPSTVYISGIMGVDPAKPYSLTGKIGSQFMIEEWGYPDIGVAICDCPSAGHDMIFLDYRTCGKDGEPEVVHIDQEGDYSITYLAGDFESFILGLSDEADDDEDEDYTAIIQHEDSLSVCFYLEQKKPTAIGEKMEEINENAYMNGYNWDAFFRHYLSKYAPDIAVGMETDPEAGLYAAYYKKTPENEARAEQFVALIGELIENEEELYRIVREEGDAILWD